MKNQQLSRRTYRSFRTADGWWSRGYLPHTDGAGQVQFVTIHQADSLPQSLHSKLNHQLGALQTSSERRSLWRQRKIQRYLDAGYGSCHLARHDVAEMIIETLEYLESKGHRFPRWIIMPNHIHLLVVVLPQIRLSALMRSLKVRTAREANMLIGRTGQFWFPEYFDRYIRDSEHLATTIRYIDTNPVKAGLVKNESDWIYGSAGWGAKKDKAN